MFRRKLFISLIIVCILSSLLFIAPCHADTTITIGQKTGKGYNYVGFDTDIIQKAINEAPATGTTTILIHEGTYPVKDTVKLRSNMKIQGDGINKTIIKGGINVANTYSNDSYLQCKNVSNVEISGITFSSDCIGVSEDPGGMGHTVQYGYCIMARDSNNITVHDCSNTKYIYNDFFRSSGSSHLTMYDCHVVTGHCAAYFYNSEHCEVYNNRILVYTNSGIRGDGAKKDVDGHTNKYHHNTIRCEKGGQAGIQFQNNCDGTEVYRNIIYDFDNATKYFCAVQDWETKDGPTSGTVTCYENVYWNCSGGIQIGDDGNISVDNAAEKNVAHWQQDQNNFYGCNLPEPELPEPNPWWSGINYTYQQNLGTTNTGTATILEFDVKPLYTNISGIIGYADSSVTIDSENDMAMILKMYNGYFYARNGGGYSKSANVSCTVNNTYHVKIIANMDTKKYDVYITPSGGSQTQIANNYAFNSCAPATNDAGKLCLNSLNGADNFMMESHTVRPGFIPSADSFVRSGIYAGENYGTCANLEVKYDPALNYTYKSYLKFNFNSLSAPVSNAKLRLYVNATDGDASTIKVYETSTKNWTEGGIIWNNAPAAGTYISAINVNAASGQWYEVDVTSFVIKNMSDKVMSLVLINEGPFTHGNKVRFNSKEATINNPELVITR